MDFKMVEADGVKFFRSKDYNYNFNKRTGYYEEWADKEENDVDIAPVPNIADIEITNLGCDNNCPYCYKANTADKAQNMTLDTFKQLLDKFPTYNGIHALTQIAFGTTGINANPDMIAIFKHCRDKGIIPNTTISGRSLTKEMAQELTNVCGAVSVSYHNENDCYNAIQMLSEAGLKQINMHYVMEAESFDKLFKVFNDLETDKRLSGLNAIVLLALKNKGRGLERKSLSKYLFSKVVNYAIDHKIKIGMDSCSAPAFLTSISNRPELKDITQLVMPCESTRGSMYISWDCKAYPCSFTDDCYDGIDLLKINNFEEEVWNSLTYQNFRSKLKGNCGECPHYKIYQE